MGTLRLLTAPQTGDGHVGEIFCCAYSPDGSAVLSAGWDGFLRLWDADSGEAVVFVQVGAKPLSSCGFTPDGSDWIAGSMEGVLSFWDGAKLEQTDHFMPHTRPISAICYSPDKQKMVTASWDRSLILWKTTPDREYRTLGNHDDITAGCRFTADGRRLLSWSHDATLRLWDMDFGTEICCLQGHTDRVTAAGISPDGRWAVSGSRDRFLKLWDLQQGQEVGSWPQNTEVRGCFFLLDGQLFAVVDAEGQVLLLSVPAMELRAELRTRLKVMCGDLSPSGEQIALGCEDGRVRFIALEGIEQGSMMVTATQTLKPCTSLLNRFFGSGKLVVSYQYTCPACRGSVESPTLPVTEFNCPACQRRLRIAAQVLQPA